MFEHLQSLASNIIDLSPFEASESNAFIVSAFVVELVASVLWSKVGTEVEEVCAISVSR